MADKAELEASPLQWVERLLEPLADESMMTQAVSVLYWVTTSCFVSTTLGGIVRVIDIARSSCQYQIQMVQTQAYPYSTSILVEVPGKRLKIETKHS